LKLDPQAIADQTNLTFQALSRSKFCASSCVLRNITTVGRTSGFSVETIENIAVAEANLLAKKI